MTATTTQGHQTINLPIDVCRLKIQCNPSSPYHILQLKTGLILQQGPVSSSTDTKVVFN